MRCIGVFYSKSFENFIAPHTTEYRYNSLNEKINNKESEIHNLNVEINRLNSEVENRTTELNLLKNELSYLL